ncbi:MAG TPA: sugar ABC transporter permease [Treponema sp.]|nr:sugar ABC transporter permease [Treponema sp.]
MKTNKYALKRNLVAFSFVVPCLVGFAAFYMLPTIRGLWYSFTDWDLFNKARFIGVQNYTKLFRDKDFWTAMKVTVLYVLLNIPAQTLLAVLIALIMNKATRHGFMRGILLTPWIMSNVVVGLLWLWMLDSSVGIVNVLLRRMGTDGINFLTSTKAALPSIAMINIWRHMGYTGLLVFAGLQSVPKEIEEAAVIDGAGPVRKLVSVVLPYIRPVMAFVVITTVIGSFQIYDTIAVTTKGGPVTATYVIYLFIYKNGFESYKMGYSSAAAMVLFAILVCISAVQMKIMKGSESN